MLISAAVFPLPTSVFLFFFFSSSVLFREWEITLWQVLFVFLLRVRLRIVTYLLLLDTN